MKNQMVYFLKNLGDEAEELDISNELTRVNLTWE